MKTPETHETVSHVDGLWERIVKSLESEPDESKIVTKGEWSSVTIDSELLAKQGKVYLICADRELDEGEYDRSTVAVVYKAADARVISRAKKSVYLLSQLIGIVNEKANNISHEERAILQKARSLVELVTREE